MECRIQYLVTNFGARHPPQELRSDRQRRGSSHSFSSFVGFGPHDDPPSHHQNTTMSSYLNLDGTFTVESDKCKYTEDAILSDYT